MVCVVYVCVCVGGVCMCVCVVCGMWEVCGECGVYVDVW